MEPKTFTKKDLLVMGFSLTNIKNLEPVGHVKSGVRGRPAALYSEAQVEQLKAGTVVKVDSGTKGAESEPTDTDPAPAVATGVDAAEVLMADSDLTEADFAAAA